MQFGAPTLELYVASYNNRSNKSNIIQVKFENEGYSNNSEAGWIKSEENYGIYNKYPNSPYSNWMASPQNTDSLFFMGGHYEYIYGEELTYINPIRPIVCIPTSVFNSKYTLVNE